MLMVQQFNNDVTINFRILLWISDLREWIGLFQNTMIILFVVPPKTLFLLSLGGIAVSLKRNWKKMLKQNFGGTAKSIMVFLKKAYAISQLVPILPNCNRGIIDSNAWTYFKRTPTIVVIRTIIWKLKLKKGERLSMASGFLPYSLA